MQRRKARFARPLFDHWLVSCFHVGTRSPLVRSSTPPATTRAQDVIIYDRLSSRGWHVPDANAVLPTEAVVASVEVKSTATRSTISGTVDNLATVKRVFGHRPRSGLAGDLVIDETTARPMGLALFFESRLSWPKFSEAVTSAIAAVVPEERPDVFLLLGAAGSGCRQTRPANRSPLARAPTTCSSSRVLTAILSSPTRSLKSRPHVGPTAPRPIRLRKASAVGSRPGPDSRITQTSTVRAVAGVRGRGAMAYSDAIRGHRRRFVLCAVAVCRGLGPQSAPMRPFLSYRPSRSVDLSRSDT